jgi:hypothetical protein
LSATSVATLVLVVPNSVMDELFPKFEEKVLIRAFLKTLVVGTANDAITSRVTCDTCGTEEVVIILILILRVLENNLRIYSILSHKLIALTITTTATRHNI